MELGYQASAEYLVQLVVCSGLEAESVLCPRNHVN